MQSAFLHCTNAVESPSTVAPPARLLLEGDFGVADRDHAEGECAAEPADHGAQRHEGEEHQHAAIAFKVRGLEDFDPGKSGADAERGPAERAQHQTQQHKQRDFHGAVSAGDACKTSLLVAAGEDEVQRFSSFRGGSEASEPGISRFRVSAGARPGMTTVAHGCIASRTLATVRRLPPAIVQLPPAILGLPPALEKPAFASEFL